MASIYVHIPFCKQACYYCDFHFSTQLAGRSKMVAAIAHEIALQREYLDRLEIKTIYFGGGTPSLLLQPELEEILDNIYKNFQVSATAEITLEANPDDLTQEKLINLKGVGINRLSIGIQSFDNEVLHFLNRAHNSYTATACIENARNAGFDNISIDLIYSIPNQPLPAWESNIELALGLSPEHISAYSLTIEEKTAFGSWQKKGLLTPMGEEPSAQQFERLMNLLEAGGYEHYEISNFCKPGFFSRHNSNYWCHEGYLGVGPSAHSFDGTSRQFNVSHNGRYIQAIEKSVVPFERERLTLANKINEYLLTSLRTSKGCDLTALMSNYHFDLKLVHADYIALLIKQEMVLVNNQHLQLTKKGKLVADKIASDFFVEE